MIRALVPGIMLAFIMLAFFQNCASSLPDMGSAPQASLGTAQAVSALSCKDILDNGAQKTSGTYWIDADGSGPQPPVQVYCDMDTDGGGWTLVARNGATTTFTTFDQPWAVYKAGFGDVSLATGTGWIGNGRLNAMTEARGLELRVSDSVQKHFYAGFQVGDESTNYTLIVANTATSLDNGRFAQSSGLPFSTKDHDVDTYTGNCAVSYLAGWWYSACYSMSFAGNNTGTVYWRNSSDALENVSWIEMWVR